MGDDEAHAWLSKGTLVGGRFRVERLIGKGGMGEVYAACDTSKGKDVALKRIRVGSRRDNVRRFWREARAASAIRHPNVVDVIELFEEADGTPVIVMELLVGEPLAAYCKRTGPLELCEAAKIFLPVASALQAVHANGIVHRDLKPDNLFLAQMAAGRTTKILDFGIAKVLDPSKLTGETPGHHTTTGSPIGTPSYMSFEQAMSDAVDHRTDIWSLGVMIFEAVTGRRPLVHDTWPQMYASFLKEDVPSIRDLVPDLPQDFGDVVDRCLAKRPSDRLDDLTILIQVLAKYADPTAPGAHAGGHSVSAEGASNAPSSSPLMLSSVEAVRPRRARLAWVPIAVAIAAVGVGASTVMLSHRAPPIQKATTAPSASTAPAVAPTAPASLEPAAPSPPPAPSSPVEPKPSSAPSSLPSPTASPALPPVTTPRSRPTAASAATVGRPVDRSGLARENPFQ